MMAHVTAAAGCAKRCRARHVPLGSSAIDHTPKGSAFGSIGTSGSAASASGEFLVGDVDHG